MDKRAQGRPLICFGCHFRLDISSQKKWLEHVQCWCTGHPVPRPERLTRLDPIEGERSSAQERSSAVSTRKKTQ